MTYFIDLDGTVLYPDKNKFTAGAKLMLRTLLRRGHQVVLISDRGPRQDGTDISMDATRRFFRDMGFPQLPVVFGVQPGRVVVDDVVGAYVYHKNSRHWDETTIGELLRPRGM